MNKIISIISLLLVINVTSVNAQSNQENEIKDQKVVIEAQLIKVRVDGLACPFCAYGLEKKFKNYDGILNLKIDLDKGLVTFTLAEGKTIDKESIQKIVKDAGFTPKEIIFPTKKVN